MRRLWLALALLAISLPAKATLPAEQSYRIANSGRLITDVYINGQGPFAFVIDTASSRTLIFEHVRKKLQLSQSQPERLLVYGINDVADALPVKPEMLSLAGETVHGLTIGVLPDAGGGPDGVLGLDVLSRYFLVLDRERMRLKLLPSGKDSARAYDGWSQVSLEARQLKKFPIRFWYLHARFNGTSITSLFDLGAAFSLLNWDAAEMLGVHKQHFASYGPPPEELQDVLGKTSTAVRAEGLEIDFPGIRWRRQSAIVADAPVFGYFDLAERPAAILGPALLANNSLAIDFADGHLYIGPEAQEPAK
jgi:predicted aspartyl protease